MPLWSLSTPILTGLGDWASAVPARSESTKAQNVKRVTNSLLLLSEPLLALS